MGTNDLDKLATLVNDCPLFVLLPGLWMPGSMFSWKHIKDYLNDLGVDYIMVEPGHLKKWIALFIRGRRPGLAQYLADQIGNAMKGRTQDRGPAIIAHSFGTVILAQMLKERHRDERLGRIVLFGSALHPSFPWHRYLKDYSTAWSLTELRNVIGELDWVLKWLAPIPAWIEGLRARFCGGEPMIGKAGLFGFTCDRNRAPLPCENHNRLYSNRDTEYEGRRNPLGRHSTPLNALDVPAWFYFLGAWPRFQGLQFIDEVSLAPREKCVPWRPVDVLFEFLHDRKTRAILVEGDKGTGKSYAAISAARKLYDHKAHDNQPIYYLDSGTVDDHTKDTIWKSIKSLPRGATLIMDDLHRSKESLALAVEALALEVRNACLLFVSRPLPSEEKYQLLRRALGRDTDSHVFCMPRGETARNDLYNLIRNALDHRLRQFSTEPTSVQQIQLNDETIAAFYDHFHDNRTDLFDAIDAWRPGKPITNELADNAIRSKWQDDPDFRLGQRPGDPSPIPGWYEQALGALIVVATWWQFEVPTCHTALAHLRLPIWSDVTSDLQSRGVLHQRVLAPKEEPDSKVNRARTNIQYVLDQELRARRYVRIAASEPMFTAHLAQNFFAYGLDLPEDAAKLTAYILMLGMLTEDHGKQAMFFREQIYRPLMFRGYAYELLRITTTLQDHLDKLAPPARVQVLADGAGIRRRIGSLEEAWSWLEEAEHLARQYEVQGALGSILYERAYVHYLNYAFDKASTMFNESAQYSRLHWIHVGEAKAAEAQFQHIIRNDEFSRNLDPTHVLNSLEPIRQLFEAKYSVLNGSKDEDAIRWACRLRLHLADVCIETGDDHKAQKLLEASDPTIREKYPTFDPVLEYLYGRLALINQLPVDALSHLEKSLKSYEAGVREPEGLGDLFIALGDTHRQRQEWTEARKYYKKAQRVDNKRKNGHFRAVVAATSRLRNC